MTIQIRLHGLLDNMEVKSNISEFIKKLEGIKSMLGGNGVPPSIPELGDVMLSASNAGMGKMKYRIFNEGKDANNESFGKYQGPKTKLTKKKYSATKYSILGTILLEDEDAEKERKKGKRNLNKAIKENPNGQYTEYEKYRLSLGRQVGYKDLEVEGSLRRSIEMVKQDNGKVVMMITNKETAKIAGYQEKQIGNIRAKQDASKGTAPPVRIFGFSKEEYDFVKAEGNAGIRQILKKLFEA